MEDQYVLAVPVYHIYLLIPLSCLAMEDAHAAILDLGGEQPDSNAFFAVYDGHGGMST